MKLFEPLTIKNMTLNNRIVMAPMALNLNIRFPRTQQYYLERALGGAGAIIVHAMPIDLFTDNSAWGDPDGLARFVDEMNSFNEQILKTGTQTGVQLWHGNLLPSAIGGQPVGLSAEHVAPSERGHRRALKQSELQSLVDKYGKAAKTVKEMGFSFVALHGAHGYLLSQFFSGRYNKRTDEYGGDVHGRMRMGIEVTKKTRECVGNDYPIFFRIGIDDDHPEGATAEEGRLFGTELEKAGADVIDVSVGNHDTFRASPRKDAEMGTYAYLAETVKQGVNVPVVAVGRINTSEIAESILTEEKADLVAIGRQLIADPYWPEKVKAGRGDDILACESCNTCFKPLMSRKWRPGDRICKVNEWAGNEIDRA